MINEIKLPDFILSTNPMVEYDGLDWIYCPKYLSLVLVICADDLTVLINNENINRPRKTFYHGEEEFELVIVQNNILATGGELAPEVSENEFLDMVWAWYDEYLTWEDGNIEMDEISDLN